MRTIENIKQDFESFVYSQLKGSDSEKHDAMVLIRSYVEAIQQKAIVENIDYIGRTVTEPEEIGSQPERSGDDPNYDKK